MMSGNMGHNSNMSHFSKKPYLIRKCISMGRRISDLINHARIFPLDSLQFFPRIMFNGVRAAMRGDCIRRMWNSRKQGISVLSDNAYYRNR